MRLFAALRPPPEAVADLDDFLDVRRAASAYRWASSEHFHVTLAFFGPVAEHRLDDLVDLLQDAATRRHRFETRVRGGGAFPNPAAAKVLWAGLDLDEGAALELDRLAVSARSAGNQVGARVDGADFRPHLTLARLGRPEDVTRWLRVLESYAGPRWPVMQLELVASHLGEGPRRQPRHEVLAALPLGAR